LRASPRFGAQLALALATESLSMRPGATTALYVEEAGEGPPLILLHGLGGSLFTWRHIVAALARGHRVIALDLKGFGHSDKPFDDHYSAVDQAALVSAFIRKRGLRGVALVGHSFGGVVALRTARDFSSESGVIRRLVVMDTPRHRPVDCRHERTQDGPRL
jgi:pimeloyl-ACP methyl ester carboxylesterase